MSEAVHLPVIADLGSRDGTLYKDALHLNAVIDKDDKGLIVRKRPGFTVTQLPGGVAQGIYHDQTYRYDARDDTLYVLNPDGSTYATQALAFSSAIYSFAGSGNLVTTPFIAFHGISNKVVYKWRWDNVLTYTTVTQITSNWVSGFVQINGAFYGMDAAGNIWGSDILDPSTWNALNKIVAPLEDGTAVAVARHYNHLVAFGSKTMSVFADAGNAVGSPLQQATNYFKRIGCYNGQTIASVNDEISWVSQTDTGYLKVMRLIGLQPSEISTPVICKYLNNPTYVVGGVAYCLNLADRYLYCVQLISSTELLTFAYDSKFGIWYYWQFATTTNSLGQHLAAAVFTQSPTDSQTYTTSFSNALNPWVYTYISMFPVGGSLQYVPISSLSSNQITIRLPFGNHGASFIAEVYVYSTIASPVVRAWSRDIVQMDDTSTMTRNTATTDLYVDGATTVANPIPFKTRSDDSDYGSLDLKSVDSVDILADMSNGGVYCRGTLDDYQTWMPYRFASLQSRVRIPDLGSFQRVAFEICTVDTYSFGLRRIDLRVKVNG